VSPQLWAWHESRVHQIARDLDLMVCLFPFEKGWYAARAPHLPVEFVGHPLLDRFAERPITAHEAIPASQPTVVLLPGSRERELNKHLPVMIQAAAIIDRACPSRFVLVLPNAALVQLARKRLPRSWAGSIQQGNLDAALTQATVALAASGTVTMECAFFGVPTVVLYRVAWPTYWAGRALIKVKYLAMPNLLADEMIFSEFIQGKARAEALAAAALHWLNDPILRQEVRAKLAGVIASLGGPGANHRAARVILRLLKGPSSSATNVP
jgi:lipid-A-disaccharide synthase